MEKKSDLVNRTRLGNAVDKGLKEKLIQLSKETNIPQSKLLDEAIMLLLKEHKKEDAATIEKAQ